MKNKITLITFGLLFILVQACTTKIPAASEVQEVKRVLEMQSDCWNKGDLECYMQGYWKSDSLLFVGSRGLTYGWNQTLKNYRKSYPDKATMGTLTFQLLEEKPLAKNAILVVGKWHLDRKSKNNLEGHFSVVFQKIDGKWVIVADHSS